MNAPIAPENFADKKYEGIQAKILTMLGNGLSNAIVATAAGVTEGYISQLLAEESFAMQVTQLRYESLQAHTARDNRYDKMEDALLEKMADLIPLMYRPAEVLRAIQVINAAKRRGASAPENITINNTVVNLSIPRHQFDRFTKTVDGQVVEVGDKSLVTIQSGTLLSKLKEYKKPLEVPPLENRETNHDAETTDKNAGVQTS